MHLPERQELHGVVRPVHAVLDAPVQPREVLPRDGLVAVEGQHVVEEVFELVLGDAGSGGRPGSKLVKLKVIFSQLSLFKFRCFQLALGILQESDPKQLIFHLIPFSGNNSTAKCTAGCTRCPDPGPACWKGESRSLPTTASRRSVTSSVEPRWMKVLHTCSDHLHRVVSYHKGRAAIRHQPACPL